MINEETQQKMQDLLQRYEAFKLKGLQLNEQDMLDFLKLQDEIDDMIIELKSKYAEEELIFDRDYGLRLIEYKQLKDLDGKKRYTVDEAKGKCDDEFYERELGLVVLKASYENLINKSRKIVEYINIVKLAVRKDFSI